MREFSRREVLEIAGSTTFGMTYLSGCIGSQKRRTRLSSIALVNLQNKKRDIIVKIFKGETKVYKETFQLKRSSNIKVEDNNIPVIDEPWMQEMAKYTIKAQIKSKESIETRYYPPDNRDGTCFSIMITVSEDGILTFPSTKADDCN